MINRNFSLLLAGQFVSQIGDKFHMIALSSWVLEKYDTGGLLMVSGLVLMPLSMVSFILYKEKKNGWATKTLSTPVS